jgi:PAS domain S-box-containing protein
VGIPEDVAMTAIPEFLEAPPSVKTSDAPVLGDENSFRLLVESVSDYAIMMLDPVGNVVSWNVGAERIKGYRAEEIIGRNNSTFYPAEAVQSGEPERLLRAAANVGRSEDEGWRVRKNGTRFWANVVTTALRDKAGALLGFSKVTRDLSERRKMESALQHVGAYNRSLIEASLDPLVTIGLDGRILDANTAAEAATGRPRVELIGTDFSDYFVDPESARTGYRLAFREGLVRNFPLELRHRDGHVISVVYNAAVYRDEQGKVIGVFAAARDVTDRKRAQEALEESERSFRVLAETVPQIVWASRADGWNVFINQRWTEYTGMTLEASYGHGWSAPIHAEDQKRTWDAWQLAMKNGSTYSAEARLRREDGAYRWWLIRGAPLCDASGKIIKWFGTFTDIHDLKTAEQEIQRLNADLERRVFERTTELEAANKELEAFAYSVSHDLRAPLRSIDGFSKILLVDYYDKLDDEGRDILTRVRRATQRMGQLIDDLLKLSRSTRTEMRREAMNLTALAAEVAKELVQAEPARAVRWIIAPGLAASGDPPLVRVVLENLLGNAWKFTGAQTDARIEFGSAETERGPAFFVRDNGAGFDMAYVGKLFGVFQRLHAVNDFPGSGIGLANVQRIIHRHGGRVWAEGETNRGATIYFTLPKASQQ